MKSPNAPASSSSRNVKPIPDGYPVLSPYLSIRDAARAIDFYKEAFGAKERMRMATPDGKVMHAEIEIEGAVVMICDEFPDWGMVSPQALNGTPVMIHVYVPDVDAFVARAEKAGCKVPMPPKDQFYGDRGSQVIDPFGHSWSFATHVEDVPEEEMQRRFKEQCGGG